MSFNEFCNLYSIGKVEKKQFRRWLGSNAYRRLAERKPGPVGMILMMEVAQIREWVRHSKERVK